MQKLKDFLLSLHHYQVYAIFLLTLLVSLLGRRMYDDAQIKAQLQEEFFSDEGEEIFAVQGDVCNEGSYVGPNCGWDCDGGLCANVGGVSFCSDCPITGGGSGVCVETLYDTQNCANRCDGGDCGYNSPGLWNCTDCPDGSGTVFDCPIISANIGTACDDNDDNTINDVINDDCECEGEIDLECVEPTPCLVSGICEAGVKYYEDRDGDDYGDSAAPGGSLCAGDTLPNGFATVGGDCNDANVSINPSAQEVCDDGVDNNCVGGVDEDCYDCPNLDKNIGDSCFDGNPNTTNDIVNIDCECTGNTPIASCKGALPTTTGIRECQPGVLPLQDTDYFDVESCRGNKECSFCYDSDTDGVCNIADKCEGYDDAIDTDNNGTPDGCEECTDSDGDGVCDDADNCDNEPGPASNNGCPVEPCGNAGGDSDGDGVCDYDDNCPDDINPDQSQWIIYEDLDGDGYYTIPINPSTGEPFRGCPSYHYNEPGSSMTTTLPAKLGDCNDADRNVNPGVSEPICDEDNIDNDCVGGDAPTCPSCTNNRCASNRKNSGQHCVGNALISCAESSDGCYYELGNENCSENNLCFGDEKVEFTCGFDTSFNSNKCIPENTDCPNCSLTSGVFTCESVGPCPDGDNDGVCDDVDLCENTPSGTTVDSDGCPIVSCANNRCASNRKNSGQHCVGNALISCAESSDGCYYELGNENCSENNLCFGDEKVEFTCGFDNSDKCIPEKTDCPNCSMTSGVFTCESVGPCPDGDNDGDGVCDVIDNCVDERGPASNNGCPLTSCDDPRCTNGDTPICNGSILVDCGIQAGCLVYVEEPPCISPDTCENTTYSNGDVVGVCVSDSNPDCRDDSDCGPNTCASDTIIRESICSNGSCIGQNNDCPAGEVCKPGRGAIPNAICEACTPQRSCELIQLDFCPNEDAGDDSCGNDCGVGRKECSSEPDPTCNDGKQNGDEEDIDCGGTISNCAPCEQECIPNVTQCTPAQKCGTISNGCPGGTIYCGGCPVGASCSNNTCITNQNPNPPAPTNPVCGNGTVETGETCDAGAQNGTTCFPPSGATSCQYCDASCKLQSVTVTPPGPGTPTPPGGGLTPGNPPGGSVTCSDTCNRYNLSKPTNATWRGTTADSCANCGWICNDGYKDDGDGQCISDEPVACGNTCSRNGPIPANATWRSISADTCENCGWQCNAGFTDNGNGVCVSDTLVCGGTCTNKGAIPPFASWNTSAPNTCTDCNWTCDAGYVESSGVCIPEQVSCSNSCSNKGDLATNASWVNATQSACTECTWICDTGYIESEGTCIQTETYSRVLGNYGSCSAECGGGTQTANYLCKNSDGDIVLDGKCTEERPIADSRSCNTDACDVCTSGESRSCGASDIGVCLFGTEFCVGGQRSGECSGDLGPRREICDTLDNDCDGLTDEEGVCEICELNEEQLCGSNVGECKRGVQECLSGDRGVCVGQIEAIGEICNDGRDNDCDGEIDEGNCKGQGGGGSGGSRGGSNYCGDGNLSLNRGEECDDGNYRDGDGCSRNCQIEDAIEQPMPENPTPSTTIETTLKNALKELRMSCRYTDAEYPEIRFRDVERSDLGDPADILRTYCIVKGYDKTNRDRFHQDAATGMGEFIKVLTKVYAIEKGVQFDEYSTYQGDIPYFDVALNKWYTPYIGYANRQGLLDAIGIQMGAIRILKPAAPISKANAAAMLKNAGIKEDYSQSLGFGRYLKRKDMAATIVEAFGETFANYRYLFGNNIDTYAGLLKQLEGKNDAEQREYIKGFVLELDKMDREYMGSRYLLHVDGAIEFLGRVLRGDFEIIDKEIKSGDDLSSEYLFLRDLFNL